MVSKHAITPISNSISLPISSSILTYKEFLGESLLWIELKTVERALGEKKVNGEAYSFTMLIAMLLMFLVPPSSVSICSVPILMSFIPRSERKWLQTTSATSTALLMAPIP